VDVAFEHGVLLDAGALTVAGQNVPVNNLAYLAAGRDELVFVAGDTPVRALLIGGVPLGESIVMWWNFIGRSHDEIVQYRQQWQAEVIEGGAGFDAAGTPAASTEPSPFPPPPTSATPSVTSIGPEAAPGGSPRRFGRLDGYPGSALPAPSLPNVRLRPRE
jgi:hypothetical protein